jgi:cob(I)alamin adenosyltransferase
MSISTKHGDGSQTGFVGGIRVLKSSARVEAHSTVDELNASLGLARSLCENEDLQNATAAIQRGLFRVGSVLATPPQSGKPKVPVTPEMVDAPTQEVRRIEAFEAVSRSSPSRESTPRPPPTMWPEWFADVQGATSCSSSNREKKSNRMVYLNRLSDPIWLFGRKLEFDADVNGSLRAANDKPGPKWSRAW